MPTGMAIITEEHHGKGSRSLGKRRTVCGVCRTARERHRACGSEKTIERLLHGACDAAGTQERGTSGGADGTWPCECPTPIAAAFVGEAPWSDEEVLAKVCERVLPSLERQEPVAAWIIDDTAIPKKGKHSVGVAHQYCGQLGKQANCQAAVSLSLANHHASLPIAWRLYLPREWTKDRERGTKAGVPRNIRFKTKPQIALDQIRAICRTDLPRGPVLMDAGLVKIPLCAQV
jgi:DDE superfamily endonuclease